MSFRYGNRDFRPGVVYIADMDTIMDRRRMAAERARRVAVLLARRGVQAQIVGSLARGDFGPHSDVDFLITSIPGGLRYRIESQVEDAMDGLPFSVLYLDEAPPMRRQALEAEAVDADRIDGIAQPA